METESESNEQLQPRWPGVIFSVFVPGFGLIRGRQFRRGVAWIAGLKIASVVLALLLALESIPLSIAAIGMALGFGALLWMLRDSFCRGRMNAKLWILFFALLVLFSLLPVPGSYIARQFKVPTGAMEPTLMGTRGGNTPDRVIVDRISYRFAGPERGDLMVFATSTIPAIAQYADSGAGESYFVKRLVGLPGEEIEIRDGSIYANGRKLGESDGIPPLEYMSFAGGAPTVKRKGRAYVVGDREYFVLGDNSANSSDSRFWGCVPESSVLGRVTKIYYPFSRMGTPKVFPRAGE